MRVAAVGVSHQQGGKSRLCGVATVDGHRSVVVSLADSRFHLAGLFGERPGRPVRRQIDRGSGTFFSLQELTPCPELEPSNPLLRSLEPSFSLAQPHGATSPTPFFFLPTSPIALQEPQIDDSPARPANSILFPQSHALPKDMDSASVKQAIIRQVQTESNVANSRELFEACAFPPRTPTTTRN